jgi:hypothetical protein
MTGAKEVDMGTYEAIAAVSQAILGILTQEYKKTNLAKAAFTLFGTQDFTFQRNRMTAQVSLFLYHVSPNVNVRNNMPATGASHPNLSMDLHYMVTAWAMKPVRQQGLLGWTAQTLNKYPIISADELNRYAADSTTRFPAEQSVQIVHETTSWDVIARLWSRLDAPYQLSYTILARNVIMD